MQEEPFRNAAYRRIELEVHQAKVAFDLGAFPRQMKLGSRLEFLTRSFWSKSRLDLRDRTARATGTADRTWIAIF